MSSVSGSNPPGGRTYSQEYFVLRGMYQEKCANGQQDDILPIMRDVKAAFADGKISKWEHDDLVHQISSRGAVSRSAEFERIYRAATRMVERHGQLSSVDTTDFLEEVQLASQHGMLYEGEEEILLSYFNTPTPKISVLPSRPSANDVPSRQRARAKQKEHTAKYHDLVGVYRDLYTGESLHVAEGKIRQFYRAVADAYQHGEITVKEYHDFHRALDDNFAFMDTIHIDVRCDAFNGFRERLLHIMSSDAEVIEVIRQIACWAIKRKGVQKEAVMNNIIAVADKYFDIFISSGMMLMTVSAREAKVIPMQEMKLS